MCVLLSHSHLSQAVYLKNFRLAPMDNFMKHLPFRHCLKLGRLSVVQRLRKSYTKGEDWEPSEFFWLSPTQKVCVGALWGKSTEISSE